MGICIAWVELQRAQDLLRAYVSYQRAVTAVERGMGTLLDRYRI